VDVLNRRLKRGWVVNQGIAGNRLLRDEVGEHALARFDRDVLSIPGLTHVLVHLGMNDLGLPGMSGEPPATSDALIEGFKALAQPPLPACRRQSAVHGRRVRLGAGSQPTCGGPGHPAEAVVDADRLLKGHAEWCIYNLWLSASTSKHARWSRPALATGPEDWQGS
jgi:hypothetical protein